MRKFILFLIIALAVIYVAGPYYTLYKIKDNLENNPNASWVNDYVDFEKIGENTSKRIEEKLASSMDDEQLSSDIGSFVGAIAAEGLKLSNSLNSSVLSLLKNPNSANNFQQMIENHPVEEIAKNASYYFKGITEFYIDLDINQNNKIDTRLTLTPQWFSWKVTDFEIIN